MNSLRDREGSHLGLIVITQGYMVQLRDQRDCNARARQTDKGETLAPPTT